MEELNVWYEKLQKMIEKHNKEREETYIVDGEEYHNEPEIVEECFEFYNEFFPVYMKYKDLREKETSEWCLAEGIKCNVMYMLAEKCGEQGACEELYYGVWNLFWRAGKCESRLG